MDMIPAISGYLMQEAKKIGSAKQKNHQRDKGILKTHITAQYTVT
jgi:hypothetical protein